MQPEGCTIAGPRPIRPFDRLTTQAEFNMLVLFS
jgi:hypothetical protein